MSTNPMTTHGAFSWMQHNGSDHGEARAFYETVLGWTVKDQPMQDGTTYPCIVAGEQPVGGFSPKPEERGAWLAYVTVDDVDARAEAARKAGGKILAPAADAPGVGRIAVIEDPLGASLALIAYESPGA